MNLCFANREMIFFKKNLVTTLIEASISTNYPENWPFWQAIGGRHGLRPSR